MKKIILVCLCISSLALSGCSTLQSLGNYLSEADAANAIREALIIGTNTGTTNLSQKGSFGKDVLLAAILPGEVQKIVQTLDRLGLASELNHFTNTLDNAATDAVIKSGPVFVGGIRRMSIRDAIGIVKGGNTSATDYLRRTVGDSFRRTVTPIMHTALGEYKIVQEWDRLVAPVKMILGNRAGLNIDLDNILTVMLTNQLFTKIEEQEIAIRTNPQARTSASLQRVFGKNWNMVPAR